MLGKVTGESYMAIAQRTGSEDGNGCSTPWEIDGMGDKGDPE